MTAIGQMSDESRMRSRKMRRLTFNIHFPVWALSAAFDLLPEDTMLVRCGYDDLANGLSTLIVWSDQFDPIHQAMVIPEIKILVTEHRRQGQQTRYDVKLMEWDNSRNEDIECEYR